MTDLDLREFERLMREQLAALETESEATQSDRKPVTLDQSAVGRLSRMDAMQMQSVAAASDRRRKVEITRIHTALTRMSNGEFGICLECGEDIAVARLTIDPAATLCIACAKRGG